MQLSIAVINKFIRKMGFIVENLRRKTPSACQQVFKQPAICGLNRVTIEKIGEGFHKGFTMSKGSVTVSMLMIEKIFSLIFSQDAKIYTKWHLCHLRKKKLFLFYS